MNDKLLEMMQVDEEGRIDIAIPGLSFTLLADNHCALWWHYILFGMEWLKAGLSHLKEL